MEKRRRIVQKRLERLELSIYQSLMEKERLDNLLILFDRIENLKVGDTLEATHRGEEIAGVVVGTSTGHVQVMVGPEDNRRLLKVAKGSVHHVGDRSAETTQK